MKIAEFEPSGTIRQGALKVAGEKNEINLLLGNDLSCWVSTPDRETAPREGFYLVDTLLFSANDKNHIAYRFPPTIMLD